MILPDPAARLAELERRCAESGTPLTVQRRAVLEELLGRTDHPTADRIHAALVRRLPDISRATVYRVLDTLGDLGLLKRIEHRGAAVRFDGNIEPHHHFVCGTCGGIEDLPLAAVSGCDDLEYRAPDRRTVDEIALIVRGRCASCNAS